MYSSFVKKITQVKKKKKEKPFLVCLFVFAIPCAGSQI